jgi:hypothetical protein
MNSDESTSTAKLADGFLVSKGYEINLDKLQDGFLSDNIICNADNINSAKYELLKKVKYEDWRLKYTGEELTYLNIPVIRRKSADLIMFDGDVITRLEIEKIKDDKKRLKKLEKILNNPNITYCYLKKNGYFYAPNSCGYVSNRTDAGIYEKVDAIKSAKYCRELYIEEIDIAKHNQMIIEKIDDLKNRIIN